MAKFSSSPDFFNFFSPKKTDDSAARSDPVPLTTFFGHRSFVSLGSFNGICGVISGINPRILESGLPTTSAQCPSSRCEANEETAPLTFFYRGTVTFLNVPRSKGDDILKHAIRISGHREGLETGTFNEGRVMVGALNRDLPMARRRSLHRFLEKRKERLSSRASPYSREEKQ
ncbi:hypothetical protein MLD38_040345 [Melastoma candidum]|uniref:Uncharacterized protein n=1 Tax=Melastoma candidum TaxID=119954 RepID=A0ACB9L4Z0_9MYRT|nr:hypothetical protein MLD38_040345 [Melastoma candidum]